MIIITTFILCLFTRLISLSISIRNEKALKKEGAVEYGKINSLALTIAHVLFYASCLTEALLSPKEITYYFYLGIALFIFAMIMLFWVINTLGNLWTVKLIISPNHELKKNFLFQHVLHPNYYLNIIPELTAMAFICHAWYTLLIGLPLYMIPLIIRIRQEEKVMKENFIDY